MKSIALKHLRKKRYHSINFINTPTHIMLMSDQKEELKKLLVTGEALIHDYHIGLYSILATDKRLIVAENFPKNLNEIEYKDIELVEYYTIIKWMNLVYAFSSFVIAGFLFIEYKKIVSLIPDFVPVTQAAIQNSLSTIYTVIIILILGIFFFGMYGIGVFAFSFLGRFRILIYEQAPIEMICKLSPELQQLIQFIDEKRRIASTKNQADTADKT